MPPFTTWADSCRLWNRPQDVKLHLRVGQKKAGANAGQRGGSQNRSMIRINARFLVDNLPTH